MNIVKLGRSLHFFNDIEILKELPLGNYELIWDPMGQCGLQRIADFTFPERLYDIEQNFRRQILTSFSYLNKNLGVLLEGYKGQGKSVTAKKLCVEADVPVIIIRNRVPINIDFTKFLSQIETKYVLFIDEFEKIFASKNGDKDSNYHTQDSFLSFMDGSMSSGINILFLLTTNDPIGDKFINRPSRVRYYKKYEFLPQTLFDMIVEDKLENKEHEKDLRENLPLVDCTIDLISTIVEEMNVHDMPYSEFKEFFNHKPKKVYYNRSVFTKGAWEYKDTIEETMPITRATHHIANRSDIDIFKIEGDYIYYKTREYVIKEIPVSELTMDDDDDDLDKIEGGVANKKATVRRSVLDTIVYRLEKSKTGNVTYAF